MALQQAERYGTPLAQTLRVMAQENRDMRMTEAEKKAAALPPKLTVPMILFFLPVLFVVILGPAAIRVIDMRHDEIRRGGSGGSRSGAGQARRPAHRASCRAAHRLLARRALLFQPFCCASICRR